YRFSFFFQAEDGIRDFHVTGVQTCALPIPIPTIPCWARPASQAAPIPKPTGRARRQGPAAPARLQQEFLTSGPAGRAYTASSSRSEERRVGKEWRIRWWAELGKRTT